MQSAFPIAVSTLALFVASGCRASSAATVVEGSTNRRPRIAAERIELAAPSPSFASRSPAPEEGPEKDEAPSDDAGDLALKLSNPIADLISVPIQGNWDTGIGPADADLITVNVQPVVPFSIGRDWNLVTRTIVPIIAPESPTTGGREESGLGDVIESLFFSPKAPTASGWIWGVGPAFLFPTASEDELGSDRWAAGPTAVVLKQENGWTYGALANHLWSFAGDDDRPDVNATFLQPFLSFTTQSHTTWTLNTESTYDWERSQWTVPIQGQVSQLLMIGRLPVSVGFGYRQFVEAPRRGPDWGLRFVLTFLFPR